MSKYYDKDYFNWQSSIGEFGGWANQTKFLDYIQPDDVVLDFGCGGGYLLDGLSVRKKLGVEINPAAADSARSKGIEVFGDSDDVPDSIVDIVISNNALEHTLRPLDELKSLYRKLKTGGRLVFVVPCESITYEYKPNDVNHHLYSWSPMCFGNLIVEAGFTLIESKPYIHKWPPNYLEIAKQGREKFEQACREYGEIETSWFQVRGIGVK